MIVDYRQETWMPDSEQVQCSKCKWVLKINGIAQPCSATCKKYYFKDAKVKPDGILEPIYDIFTQTREEGFYINCQYFQENK